MNCGDSYLDNKYKPSDYEVLKRAAYRCGYYGEYANTAHHIEPRKLEPFFALGPENGIACCKEYHNKYSHMDECSTWALSRIECN